MNTFALPIFTTQSYAVGLRDLTIFSITSCYGIVNPKIVVTPKEKMSNKFAEYNNYNKLTIYYYNIKLSPGKRCLHRRTGGTAAIS